MPQQIRGRRHGRDWVGTGRFAAACAAVAGVMAIALLSGKVAVCVCRWYQHESLVRLTAKAKAGKPIVISRWKFRALRAAIYQSKDTRLLRDCALSLLVKSCDCEFESVSEMNQIQDYCMDRLVMIGTPEAAEALVSLLDYTDAGASYMLYAAITSIGRPALPYLANYKGTRWKEETAKELYQDILAGKVRW